MCYFFRLYTYTLFKDVFLESKSGGYKMVMERNIDVNASFNSLDLSIEKTLTEKNAAFYCLKTYVTYSEKYRCKVNMLLSILTFKCIIIFFFF